jgi:hypothetical protein
MKAYQRIALWKATELLLYVPLPQLGHGMKTASMAGAMKFAHDMNEARQHFRQVREAALCGDPPVEVNEALERFVEWFEQRRRADWS